MLKMKFTSISFHRSMSVQRSLNVNQKIYCSKRIIFMKHDNLLWFNAINGIMAIIYLKGKMKWKWKCMMNSIAMAAVSCKQWPDKISFRPSRCGIILCVHFFFSIGISTHIIIVIMNSIIIVTWDLNLNQNEKLLWLLTRAIKKINYIYLSCIMNSVHTMLGNLFPGVVMHIFLFKKTILH